MADTCPIRFISTSTVRPSSGNNGGVSHRRIELTPSDLTVLQVAGSRRGLLFHKPSSSSTIELVENIKHALSRALDIFFPLAGRLVDNDDTQTKSFFIDCSGEGAHFVHAALESVSVGDFLSEVGTVSDEILSSFFLMSRVLNCEAANSKLPLLAVQVTELSDGVFVACTMNHVVGDGATFWHFFNVWSKISCCKYKGISPQPFQQPVFGREYLEGVVDLPIRVPISLVQTRYSPAEALQLRIVHFSKEKIAELKAKANAGNTGSYVISSLQAVMAHLWICVTRSRHLSPETLVIYVMAVGLRPRLEPPLSEFYFGNAFMPVAVRATAGELLERGSGWAARQMNNAITAQSPGEANKFFKGNWAETVSQLSQTMTQRRPSSVMITGGSPHYNIYGNDFGWGRPLTVRGPARQFDGTAPVFPGAEEGSLDFELVLRPETFCVLADDVEFVGTLAK